MAELVKWLEFLVKIKKKGEIKMEQEIKKLIEDYEKNYLKNNPNKKKVYFQDFAIFLNAFQAIKEKISYCSYNLERLLIEELRQC